MKIIVDFISPIDSEMLPFFKGNRFEDVNSYMFLDSPLIILIGSPKERQAYLGWLVTQKPNAKLMYQYNSIKGFKRAQKRHRNLDSCYLIQLV